MEAVSTRRWMASGVLLIVGGALEALGASVVNVGTIDIGSPVTFAAATLSFVGVIVFGLGFSRLTQRPARRFLISTGIVGLVALLFALLSVANHNLLGVFVIGGQIETVLLLISAIVVRVGARANTPISWALLPAAIWGVIDTVLLFAGVGGEWWTLVIAGILFIAAGIAIRSGSARIAAHQLDEVEGSS